MRDAVWCLADPHFFPGDRALGTLTRFVDAMLSTEVPTLVLLGDSFTVWVGFGAEQNRENLHYLRELQRLRASGREIIYLKGNRDYGLSHLPDAPFDFLGDRWAWTAPSGGARIRFEHGDLINTADESYLRWRLLSRSKAVQGLFRHLPPGVQSRAARMLQSRMDLTNQIYKRYEPRAEMERWARSLLERDFTGAVVGHFHRDSDRVVAGIRVRFVPRSARRETTCA